MANIDGIADDPSEPVFISSPSYAQSAEKIRDFLAMYPDGPYVPFEYLSLSELYQRHCPEVSGFRNSTPSKWVGPLG
jgi:hypothetical protein